MKRDPRPAPGSNSSNTHTKKTKMTDPMTHGIIALAVLALLCGLRRRRTGRVDANKETLALLENWRSGK